MESKKLLKPSDNKIQVSSKKSVKNLIFIAKIFLREFPTVELHSLGNAITNAVQVSENMQRFGLVRVKKITTATYESETPGEERRGKRVKMIITVEKTEKFDELTKDLH